VAERNKTQTNFAETKSIARTRLQSTIAVSRLTGVVKEYTHLRASLAAITNYSKRDAFSNQIQSQTDGLCKRLLEARHLLLLTSRFLLALMMDGRVLVGAGDPALGGHGQLCL